MKRFMIAVAICAALFASAAPAAFARDGHGPGRGPGPGWGHPEHGPGWNHGPAWGHGRDWGRGWDRRHYWGFGWYWLNPGVAIIWMGPAYGYVETPVIYDPNTGWYYWVDNNGVSHWLD